MRNTLSTTSQGPAVVASRPRFVRPPTSSGTAPAIVSQRGFTWRWAAHRLLIFSGPQSDGGRHQGGFQNRRWRRGLAGGHESRSHRRTQAQHPEVSGAAITARETVGPVSALAIAAFEAIPTLPVGQQSVVTPVGAVDGRYQLEDAAIVVEQPHLGIGRRRDERHFPFKQGERQTQHGPYRLLVGRRQDHAHDRLEDHQWADHGHEPQDRREKPLPAGNQDQVLDETDRPAQDLHRRRDPGRQLGREEPVALPPLLHPGRGQTQKRQQDHGAETVPFAASLGDRPHGRRGNRGGVERDDVAHGGRVRATDEGPTDDRCRREFGPQPRTVGRATPRPSPEPVLAAPATRGQVGGW